MGVKLPETRPFVQQLVHSTENINRECYVLVPNKRYHVDPNISMMTYAGRTVLLPFEWLYPDSKVNGANMGPTWVLYVVPRWAPCRPHEPCYQGGCVRGRLGGRQPVSFVFIAGSVSLLCITLVRMILDMRRPGPWFNIKMSSYHYRKSHTGGKTVVRSSYLHNGISFTGKMTYFYWISPQTTSSPYLQMPRCQNRCQGITNNYADFIMVMV